VRLFSLDELVFIGPGSEWFWAALSGIVTMVTLLAIWRQLRLQASQAAIAQVAAFSKEWESERFVAYGLDIALALKGGADPTKLPFQAALKLAGYWEDIGALVRKRHLDRRLLWDSSSGEYCRFAWAYLGAWCLAGRAEIGPPTAWEHFEWLADVLGEMDRRSGSTTPVDLAFVIANLDRHIASYRRALAVEQSLRTVLVASPDVLTAGQRPATARTVAES